MRLCPTDGNELTLEFQGYITNYYRCSKCKQHFKGFMGDSDEKPEAES